jgi:hypothetical protein
LIMIELKQLVGNKHSHDMANAFGRTRLAMAGLLAMMALAQCAAPYEPPTTALDCGRQFIEALYDGNFKRVRQLAAANAANFSAIEQRFEEAHRQMSSTQRDNLRNTSITIHGVRPASADTSAKVTVIFFANAYTNAADSIVVRRINADYKADLTYKAP